MEKKILLPLLLGLKPETFWSRVHCCTTKLTPLPTHENNITVLSCGWTWSVRAAGWGTCISRSKRRGRFCTLSRISSRSFSYCSRRASSSSLQHHHVTPTVHRSILSPHSCHVTQTHKRFKKNAIYYWVQELCESWGGDPGFPVLMSLMVSVNVKLYRTMRTHWSQFVPSMSTQHLRTLSSTSSFIY